MERQRQREAREGSKKQIHSNQTFALNPEGNASSTAKLTGNQNQQNCFAATNAGAEAENLSVKTAY